MNYWYFSDEFMYELSKDHLDLVYFNYNIYLVYYY